MREEFFFATFEAGMLLKTNVGGNNNPGRPCHVIENKLVIE
jgi:hypothetical protein